jgi:hypothetical protein
MKAGKNTVELSSMFKNQMTTQTLFFFSGSLLGLMFLHQ